MHEVELQIGDHIESVDGLGVPHRAGLIRKCGDSCSRRALRCEPSNSRCRRDRGAASPMGSAGIGVVSRPGIRMCRSLCRSPVAAKEKFVGRFGDRGVIKGMDSNNPMPDRGGVWPLRSAMEPYVSRYELARLMGISVATVDRMVAEGMPSVTWGRRTRRFRPSAAIDWAAERGRAA